MGRTESSSRFRQGGSRKKESLVTVGKHKQVKLHSTPRHAQNTPHTYTWTMVAYGRFPRRLRVLMALRSTRNQQALFRTQVLEALHHDDFSALSRHIGCAVTKLLNLGTGSRFDEIGFSPGLGVKLGCAGMFDSRPGITPVG